MCQLRYIRTFVRICFRVGIVSELIRSIFHPGFPPFSLGALAVSYIPFPFNFFSLDRGTECRQKRQTYIYPETFIKFSAIIYEIFHLPYRQMEGFYRKLSHYINKIKAADYTTLFRRMQNPKGRGEDAEKDWDT